MASSDDESFFSNDEEHANQISEIRRFRDPVHDYSMLLFVSDAFVDCSMLCVAVPFSPLVCAIIDTYASFMKGRMGNV